ncbi:hypothetical protein ACQP25_32555 [Microtetraspora malaysiensis]|uniref:hypothetical protein n=1 Tax=Microtetraspora malaysiensis TaxID=161358 RepID=UPI003D8E8BE3
MRIPPTPLPVAHARTADPMAEGVGGDGNQGACMRTRRVGALAALITVTPAYGRSAVAAR